MTHLQSGSLVEFLKKLFYITFASAENRCLVCNEEITHREEYLCDNCKQKLSTDELPKCPSCNRIVYEGLCRYCKQNKKTYEKVYTVFEYTEPIDKFINEFKEQGKTIYGRMFVKQLFDKFDDFQIKNIDMITSVPANKLRKVARLRDAPKFFAKALSKNTGIEYAEGCLKRKGFAKAMRKKTPKQRLELAQKSYFLGSSDIKGKNILLVDDVFTTGSTTHVCANLLKNGGAKSVNILVIACVKSR